MKAASDIIEALNARAAAPKRMGAATRESWSAWVDRIATRPNRASGAPAQSLVEEFSARPLVSPPRRSAPLNRWQAFAALWRQQWHSASSDERSWRWTAGGASAMWHVLILILIAWVTALHFIPADDDEAGEALLVEYIGTGTPEDEGGGEPPAPAARPDSPADASAPSSAGGVPAPVAPPTPALSAPSMPTPEVMAPVPDVAAREIPEPAQAPQPLVVTTPVAPEPAVFELPPTTPPTPQVTLPEITRVPPVRVVEIPEPIRAPPVEITTPQVAIEPIAAPRPSVATRDVPTPVRLPALRAPAPAVTSVPSVAPTPPQVVQREIPAPAAAAPTPPRPAVAPSPSTSTAQTPATSSSRSDPSPRVAGPDVPSRNPGIGTGPRAVPAPGSWATPRRADDWGESRRNVPGRGDGVFEGDGRPRIGAAPGSASPGRPPGTVTQDIADLDRAGTWLRRKANSYEPTRFDRFWRPNETLLEEWVRRGIKQVSIPIPGSNKRLVCGISILQLGGGCWPVDPNVNEQPATARPPPDIPFKPHLQEGQGVTVPPAPPAVPPGG